METTLPEQISLLSETVETYRVVDVFSGCGGMTLGFVKPTSTREEIHGRFEPVWAVDYDANAIDSYRANFDADGAHSVCADVRELFEAGVDVPAADVVIGGPPCQGFSLLNKKKAGDERRELWWYFMEAVRLSGARVVVMENVRQLISSPEFQQILERLRELGFAHVTAHVLTAADYGAPQLRHRTILMASRVGPISLPRPSHLNPSVLKNVSAQRREELGLRPWRTVKDAIGDLPEPEGDVVKRRGVHDLHVNRNPTAKSMERYKAVPPGGNRFDLLANRPDITPNCWKKKKSGGTDLFGRLWWDKPSVTVRTEFYKPEKGRYLHPVQHRPITLREGARLQSFPDDFVFCGKARNALSTQIGNAVPPLLAEAIANEVQRTLSGQTTKTYVDNTNALFQELLGEDVGKGYL
ncbi:DNA cytosine methyltransferase [Lujinxingia sediminis]|uniref:Cytosine-specific methyltransferase n=2 Tax=Lujinxingia sediminis TaxID=2480984 RepID=A0ABY0CVF9_9DELT|nr:DNA cytosine methyltransferase [Lujinxingia sediminis]